MLPSATELLLAQEHRADPFAQRIRVAPAVGCSHTRSTGAMSRAAPGDEIGQDADGIDGLRAAPGMGIGASRIRRRGHPVANQMANVFADSVAVAQVMVAEQHAVGRPQVLRAGLNDAHGERSQVAQCAADGFGRMSPISPLRLRSPLVDLRRRLGHRMWPARSSVGNKVRAAISLMRLRALRQPHRRLRFSLSRILARSGCSARSLRIRSISWALNSHPCTTLARVMIHTV